mmetsp:Transcript_4466/g.20266  ORF Transcript_4466/g.20266 Transcript_4466/m.20266 type:complete len:299 (-) Transcript_4466:489-1385(-)
MRQLQRGVETHHGGDGSRRRGSNAGGTRRRTRRSQRTDTRGIKRVTRTTLFEGLVGARTRRCRLASNVLLISTRCFARSSLLGSEEVVRHLVLRPSQLRIDRPAKLIKLEEIPVHPLVNLHDRRLVPASVAVIRRAEHRHHRLIVRPLVPVLHQLVRSGDQVQAVAVVELLRDVLTERVPRASRGDAPAAPVVGVGPQQVAHRAFVRHLLRPRELAYVLQRVQTGAQAAVRAEDLVLDSRRQGQVVEHVGDVLPHVRVAVLAQALVVEAVHLRDLPALVVTPDQEYAVGVPNLERQQE